MGQLHVRVIRQAARIGGVTKLTAYVVVPLGVLFASAPAVAYLDPGGAYIAFQWLLGLVAVGAVTCLAYWRLLTGTVRRWLRRGRRKGEHSRVEDDAE